VRVFAVHLNGGQAGVLGGHVSVPTAALLDVAGRIDRVQRLVALVRD